MSLLDQEAEFRGVLKAGYGVSPPATSFIDSLGAQLAKTLVANTHAPDGPPCIGMGLVSRRMPWGRVVALAATFLLVIGPLFLVFVKAALAGGHARPDFTGLSFGFVFLGIIPLLYISIAWVFTFVLVIDKGLGPWTAMEVSRRVVTRQWFRVFITVFFGAILAMLGLIGLIIGVIFTLPLMIGATLFAYEDLFNPPPPA